jgi:hypothetical protein
MLPIELLIVYQNDHSLSRIPARRQDRHCCHLHPAADPTDRSGDVSQRLVWAESQSLRYSIIKQDAYYGEEPHPKTP